MVAVGRSAGRRTALPSCGPARGGKGGCAVRAGTRTRKPPLCVGARQRVRAFRSEIVREIDTVRGRRCESARAYHPNHRTAGLGRAPFPVPRPASPYPRSAAHRAGAAMLAACR